MSLLLRKKSDDLTECRALQTPLPSIPLTRDIHWGTSETSPIKTAEENMTIPKLVMFKIQQEPETKEIIQQVINYV